MKQMSPTKLVIRFRLLVPLLLRGSTSLVFSGADIRSLTVNMASLAPDQE